MYHLLKIEFAKDFLIIIILSVGNKAKTHLSRDLTQKTNMVHSIWWICQLGILHYLLTERGRFTCLKEILQ